MQVYIANLGKHTESKAVGAWFRLPINYEDVAEKIGLNTEYEEYAIHDYKLPFEIGEYVSIDELNRLYELVTTLEGTSVYNALPELLSYGCFHGMDDLIEQQEEIHHWSGCEDMTDVARQCVEELGLWDVPERLWNYLDYEAMGQTLEISGIFIFTRQGIFEVQQ